MNDRLVAINDRLARADENIEVLKGYLRTYHASNAYRLVGKHKPGTDGGITIKGRIAPPDVRVFTLAGDIIHELRSTLDHLAWQFVRGNGGTPTDNTSYPILSVPPTANKKGVHPPPNVIGGVSSGALTIIEKSQPYKWGANFAVHPLFVLHWLSVRDKHRHIPIRGAAVKGLRFLGDPGNRTFSWTATTVTSDEHGAEISFVPDDSTVHVEGQATLNVVVQDSGVGLNSPLLKTLTDIRMAVWTVVDESARTCFSVSPGGPSWPTV
jgi:hypothetical protein